MKEKTIEEKERLNLFREYVDYMLMLDSDFVYANEKEKAVRKWFTEQINSNNIEWIDVRKNGTIVGFLIIGTGEECHRDADYFIMQTYIKPEYRRQGIMKNVLERYFSAHKGVYCLDIIKTNENAKKFWKSVFKGFKPIQLIDYRKNVENIDIYAYEI